MHSHDDVVREWAIKNKSLADGELRQAYREGCYRIHCAGLAVIGLAVPDYADFSFYLMQRPYDS